MAFMGMFMAFLVIVLVILGISSTIAIICFVSAGLIMLAKKKKNRDGGKVKAPASVIVLRIFGSIATIPIVLAIGIIIYAVIDDAIDKKTNLPRAVMSYDFDQAEKILKSGADPDIRDENGRTLLMCMIDHEVYVSTEDGKRYEVDTTDFWNDEEDLQMMELLLEYGADVDATVTDCGDETAHEYEEGGWTDIYANSDHICGNTALIEAVRYRSADVVEFLIDNGADVNVENACGFTPILMAADTRSDANDGLEITEMLLDEGADPNTETNFHQDITWLLTRQNTDANSGITQLIEAELR